LKSEFSATLLELGDEGGSANSAGDCLSDEAEPDDGEQIFASPTAGPEIANADLIP
jgi:hypothetical protein